MLVWHSGTEREGVRTTQIPQNRLQRIHANIEHRGEGSIISLCVQSEMHLQTRFIRFRILCELISINRQKNASVHVFQGLARMCVVCFVLGLCPFKTQTDPANPINLVIESFANLLPLTLNKGCVLVFRGLARKCVVCFVSGLCSFKTQTNPTNPTNPEFHPAQKAD